MGDAIDTFDAAADDVAVVTVGTREYEFAAEDLPALKAIFADLTIEGEELPDLEWDDSVRQRE